MTILLDLIVKATVLIALAAVASVALHRASAAARHVVWTLAAAGCLLLPVLALTLPAWRLDALPDLRPAALVRAEAERAVAEETVVMDAAEPSGEIAAPAATPTDPVAATATSARRASIPWYLWAWAGGAVAVLGVFLSGALHLRGVARRARPLDEPEWREDAAELAAAAGLDPGAVRLLRAVDRVTPMTWGVFRPVIVLPRDCVDWTAEQRREVLIHELAHAARGDVATQWLANLACVVWWAHPLVWWTARRMLVERERACDDRVIDGGATPSGYAKHLLDIARTLGAGARTAPAGVAMARRTQVSGRLLQVLDPACNRGRPARGHVTAAAAVALAVLVPLAVLQPGQPALAALSGAPAESWDPAGDGPGASPGSWSLAQIRDSIEDANHCIVESITSRDVDSIVDRYSPDAVVHGMGGVTRHGRAQVEALYREVYEKGFRKLTIETLELRRLADDLVYELGRFTYDHKDGRTSLNGRFQTVWRYEDGRWLVYRDMSNF